MKVYKNKILTGTYFRLSDQRSSPQKNSVYYETLIVEKESFIHIFKVVQVGRGLGQRPCEKKVFVL